MLKPFAAMLRIGVRHSQTQKIRSKSPSFRALTSTAPCHSLSMRGNRKTGTKPEVILARELRRLGKRFNVNDENVAGCPDVVFHRARLAIFCDGDFWHGKNWARRKALLTGGSNASYWVRKIEANRGRDARLNRELRQAGWTVLRFWESEILKCPTQVAKTIVGVAAQPVVGRQWQIRRPIIQPIGTRCQ